MTVRLRTVILGVMDLPVAWIVDLDGTVALRGEDAGARGPYDWERVGEDRPNRPVITLVRAIAAYGRNVIFMSGRMDTGTCRYQTDIWLRTHVCDHARRICIGGWPLLMRPEGDMRPDPVVKRELYEEHVQGVYDVEGVLDDRDRVIRMWREELGLMCAQVAQGNFL